MLASEFINFIYKAIQLKADSESNEALNTNLIKFVWSIYTKSTTKRRNFEKLPLGGDTFWNVTANDRSSPGEISTFFDRIKCKSSQFTS